MQPHEELIAFANAALALGDWRFPPVGARVEFTLGGWGLAEVTRCVWGRTPEGEPYPHYCTANVSIEDHDVYIGPGALYQVRRLPLDAPPFEEWHRPVFDVVTRAF